MSVLDEALERFAATGPEFHGGLSNHGPMAAEALVRLGRDEAVSGWVSGYIGRLDDLPSPDTRITSVNWHEALGDLRRAADWSDHFADRLAEAPWRDVLATWWPRLLPGLAAGATHGVIRTSHAVRALTERESPQRITELAFALGYWAAGYARLPGRPVVSGDRTLGQAIDRLPLMAEEPTGMITTHLGRLTGVPGFPAAVSALAPRPDPRVAIGDLSRAFAEVLLTHGRARPVIFLHAVTAPIAVRSILGELPEPLWQPTHDALWQVAAAIYSGYAGPAPEPLPGGDPPAPSDVAERAVAVGDEHTIKLAEACVRMHAETGDPIYLHAANFTVGLLER